MIFEDLPNIRSEFYRAAAAILRSCRGKLVFLLNTTVYK